MCRVYKSASEKEKQKLEQEREMMSMRRVREAAGAKQQEG
jgi:hypothetical protein